MVRRTGKGDKDGKLNPTCGVSVTVGKIMIYPSPSLLVLEKATILSTIDSRASLSAQSGFRACDACQGVFVLTKSIEIFLLTAVDLGFANADFFGVRYAWRTRKLFPPERVSQLRQFESSRCSPSSWRANRFLDSACFPCSPGPMPVGCGLDRVGIKPEFDDHRPDFVQ